MTILQQVLLAFAAFVLFIFAIRLVFALLLRLQLLPILVWLGVGRLYPQWAAAHPFVFYGVLALFALLALSCWSARWWSGYRNGKCCGWPSGRSKTICTVPMQRDAPLPDFSCATAYPSLNIRTEKRRASARRFLIARTSPLQSVPPP